MKSLDFKSIAVAALIGAVIFYFVSQFAILPALSTKEKLSAGAITGALVQIGVRLIGVS